MLDDGGHRVSDDDLWYACDALSGPLERLASGLIASSEVDLASIFELGPILHFERLEVRQDLRGSRIGVTLARSLIAELVNRFSPALLVLCPYPLQFEDCGPESESDATTQARYNKSFSANKHKLAILYEREFGVVRLRSDSDYWGVALSGFRFLHGSEGWVVW